MFFYTKNPCFFYTNCEFETILTLNKTMELIKLKKSKRKIINISIAAVIAALYVVLTYLASAMGLASFAVQVRFSEALTILPIFTPAAIPGLFVGCVLANVLTGCALWDVIFGSLATLIGALGTFLLKKYKILATLPPIIANTIIVPFVLLNVYNLEGTYWFFALTVCLGEIISCGVLGSLLRKSLEKRKLFDRFK